MGFYKMIFSRRPKMKNLKLVWFYNDDIQDVKGVGCGYRHFEVKTVGYKWVSLRPHAWRLSNDGRGFKRISRSKWDAIVASKSFREVA